MRPDRRRSWVRRAVANATPAEAQLLAMLVFAAFIFALFLFG